MTKKPIAFLALAALSLSACTPSSPNEGEPAPSPTPTEQPTEQIVELTGPGEFRQPNQCAAFSSKPANLTEAVKAVNGEAPSGNVRDLSSEPVEQWNGTTSATSADGDRLQLIGASNNAFLAGGQILPPESVNPPTSVGLWREGVFTAFTGPTLLPDQLEGSHTPAALAGSMNQGQAVWTEQLLDTKQPPNAGEMAWRVLVAPEEGGEATEVLSSWALTQQEVTPAPTPWFPPATTGSKVLSEAYVQDDTGQWVQALVHVDLSDPNTEPTVTTQARLPVAVGESAGWVEDTTNNGIEAELDTFTIRWENDAYDPITIELADYFKVQWLAASESDLIVTIQDRCSARTWTAQFDRETEAFTNWVYSINDGVAASLNGNTYVWGNGSGNSGGEMYRWDLESGEVTTLGSTLGFAVPFTTGTSVAVPNFPENSTNPTVQWDVKK
ncbi:MAG: hypothetical protein Q4D87_06425 [Actinomycetaceae bacterium]|nr:hypothetical protein [Actinomycetaceae bacterium]